MSEKAIPVSKKKSGKPIYSDVTKIVLALVFIALVFVPLIRMFTYLDIESIKKVAATSTFVTAIINSVVSAVIGTVLTVVIAFALAVAIQRTTIKLKGVFGIILTLPMLIPSISSGMGLIILLGNNGVLTRLLGLDGNIYGIKGIVIGSIVYAFPVAFLMLSDVIRYEDGSPYEAAEILGIPKHRQFLAITLPYLRKPLISVIFATFTLIVTDYGVPLMVGGKYTTVATVMYQEVIGQLDFGKGAVYGTILLIPAIIAFVIDLMNKDKGKMTFVTKECKQADSVFAKAVSYIYCSTVAILTLLPIASFIILAFAKNYPNDLSFTFANVIKTFNLKADAYLLNSVMIALLSAAIGVVIAFTSAYLSARMKSPASRFLHLSSITSAAIPGVVLGLSYVLTFSKTPIYGTVIILVLVNMVHFISSPYLMMYNSFSKVNENLEGTAETLGIGKLHLIKDVLIPQCKGTIFEMFSYFFVNCMMTISAVSFLANTSNKPISLMINQFEAQAQFEYAAVVSILILIVNLVIKTVVYLLNKKGAK